jgi:hypothetical protein
MTLLTLLQSVGAPIVERFLPNGGSGGTRKHHQPERWQDHVPSFVLQEQRKAALEKQQKRNAAIMALAI